MILDKYIEGYKEGKQVVDAIKANYVKCPSCDGKGWICNGDCAECCKCGHEWTCHDCHGLGFYKVEE